jgi:hypothetical protein
MIVYARTYGSRNHPGCMDQSWKFPTNPEQDIFGVRISNNITFGLEEFNFNEILQEQKLAYVPCYGTEQFRPRPQVCQLRLLYKIENMGTRYCHYATLYNVTQLYDSEITPIQKLIDNKFDDIYLGKESNELFGNQFDAYEKQITRMYNSRTIANNQDRSSFIVNLRYEQLEILKNPLYCNLRSHYASQWKRNVLFE